MGVDSREKKEGKMPETACNRITHYRITLDKGSKGSKGMRDVLNPGKCKQCHLPLEYEGGFLGDDVCYGCVVRNHKKEVRMRDLLLTMGIGAGLAIALILGILWVVK